MTENENVFKLLEFEQNERNQRNYAKSLDYSTAIVTFY